MKNLLLTSLCFIFILSSCSSDDDGDIEIPPVTTQGQLVEYSPWNYNGNEVIQVFSNTGDFTNDELSQIVEESDNYIETIDFTSDTEVSVTSANATLTGTWEYSTLNSTVTLIFDQGEIIIGNVEVNSNEFSYTYDMDYLAENGLDGAYWRFRVFLN